jgi:hypothetical protein
MTRALKNAAAGAVLALAALAGAAGASAQQLDPGISCLNGEVPANDWGDLSSNYKESIWDSKAVIRLRAASSDWSWGNGSEDDDGTVFISVTDNFGTNVCDASQSTTKRCRFSFASSYSGIFNIKITNNRSDNFRYRLCAE